MCLEAHLSLRVYAALPPTGLPCPCSDVCGCGLGLGMAWQKTLFIVQLDLRNELKDIVLSVLEHGQNPPIAALQ